MSHSQSTELEKRVRRQTWPTTGATAEKWLQTPEIQFGEATSLETIHDAESERNALGPSVGTFHVKTLVKDLDPEELSRVDQNLPLKVSLGLSGCLIGGGGSVLILAAIAALTFLWFGAGDSLESVDAPWLWRRIALRGWTSQAITLIALLIRTIVAAQAAVCTSMMAAIVLERHCIPRTQVARLSVFRGINDGPRALAQLLVSSKSLGQFRRYDTLLTILLVLEVTGLQFSSTILLSDVSFTGIVGDAVTTRVQTLISESGEGFPTGVGEYILSPPLLAAFGELKPNITTALDVNGVSDTGMVHRAFLPLPDSGKRTAIRLYEGYLTVLSSRTTCMRPKIQDIKYNAHGWMEWEDQFWGRLNGTLDYGSNLEATVGARPCGVEDCPVLPFGAKFREVILHRGGKAISACSMVLEATIGEVIRGPRDRQFMSPSL
ncbi:hypothetical protein HD806DRAFT_538372 [Xylariaceae sp. AK1471]|nr:hypothetical protein HD806DRAFT_538372 [Xylariaceae sp. AK1471]